MSVAVMSTAPQPKASRHGLVHVLAHSKVIVVLVMNEDERILTSKNL